MAGRQQSTGTELPPPPPVRAPKRPPGLLSFGATLTAVVATGMSLPAAATAMTPASGLPGWQGPSGWQEDLRAFAFVIGASSMALAIWAIHLEGQRKSRLGKLLAWGAAGVAWVGACIWVLPFLVQIGSGL